MMLRHWLLFFASIATLFAGAPAAMAQEPEVPGPPRIAAVDLFEAGRFGDAVSVSDVRIRLERFDVHLAEGRAAPFLVGDETVGFFFSGIGSWTYRSTEPDEASAVIANAKAAGGLRTRSGDGALFVDGNLEEVFLWARGVPLPALEGKAAPPLDGEYAALRKSFDRADLPPSSHLFAHQSVDLPQAPMVRAEIRNGPGRFVYTHDGVESRSVSLLRLRTMQFMLNPDAVIPVPVSWQPIEGNLRSFQEPVALLTHMDIDLRCNGEDAALVVTSTIIPRLRDQRLFRLGLEQEVFDKYRKTRLWSVTSVTDAAGNDVPFAQSLSEIAVLLPEPMTKDKGFDLTFAISGPVLVRYGGSDFWRLWDLGWYPRFDGAGTYATVDATIRVHSPFLPIAGGTTIERREEDGVHVLVSRMEHPVQYYTITAGRYHVEEETRGDQTVRVATYALQNKRASKKLLNLAHLLIDFYEDWLGPFPFKEFQIVQADSLGWGQAPAGMMIITDEAFTPFFYAPWSQGINHRYAHEIAHQYWGHLIKWPSPHEEWFAETFADVSASFALKKLRGQDDFDALFRDWKTRASHTGDRVSIAMANRIRWSTDSAFADRTNLLYAKGPLVLFRLRNELGGKKFAQYLHGYVKSRPWRFTTTEEFLSVLNRSTGKDYSALFERYYWGTEMPIVSAPNR